MIQYPADYCPSLARRGICGVMAVSICAKVNFDIAFAAARRTLGDDGKRFRGGMHVGHLLRCLEELGVNFNHAMMADDVNITLEQWVNTRPKWGETYIVYVTGHYVTTRDGHVADQGFNGHVSKSRTRRRKVLGWVRIREAAGIQLDVAA